MADEIAGLAVKIAMDDSSFTTGVQNLKRQLNVIDSGFKASVTSSESFGKSLDGLKEKASSLGDKIQVQQQIVSKYQDQLKKAQQSLEDESKTMMDLKDKVDKARAAWEESLITMGENTDASIKLKNELAALEKEYQKQEQDVVKNAKSVDGYTVQTNKQQTALNSMRTELENTNKQIEMQSSAWGKVGTALETAGNNMSKYSQKISDIGQTLTWGVSLPIAGVGIASAKMATTFENSMAQVSTIADTTQTSMTDLNKGIIQLSGDTGKSADDMAQGLYQAISSGVETGNALEFMGTASKSAIGGFTDTQTAVDGLTTVLNSYGLKADEVTKISNQMMVAQNLGKTTFGEMAQQMGNVTPIAAALGVQTNELFSSLGVLTANGIHTREAVTGLKSAMSNIIKPSKEASDAAQALGIDFDANTVKTKGWLPFLQDVQSKLKEASPEFAKVSNEILRLTSRQYTLQQSGKKSSDEYKQNATQLKALKGEMNSIEQASNGPLSAFATMFGSVEGLNSILTLTSSQGVDLYNESMKEMGSNTDFTNDAFEKMENTTGAKLEKSFNDLKNAGIQLGASMAPVLTEIADDLKGVADWMNNLDPSTRTLIINTGLVVAAAGPLLTIAGGFLKVAGPIITGIGKISTGLAGMRAASVVAATATEGATVAAEGLAGAGVVAGEAAGGAAVATGGFAAGLGALATVALPAVAVIAGVGAAAYGVHYAITQKAVPSVDLFDNKFQETTKTMNEYGDMVDTTVTKTVNFSDATKKAVGSYMQMDDNVKKTMTDIYVNSDKFSTDAKNSVIAQYTDMANKVSTLNGDAKDTVITNFTNMVNSTTTLTNENKTKIAAEYADMVGRVTKLSGDEKQQVINDFKETLTQTTGLTQTQVNNVTSQFTAMGNAIKQGMDNQYNDRLQQTQAFFNKSTALNNQDEQQILQKMQADNDSKKRTIDFYENQISGIYANAANQHRQLSQQEQQEVNNIQNEMKTNAITSLSSTEIESKVLLERMKSYGSSITQQQASEIIQNANKQRDGSIAAANDQYNKNVANFVYQRDVLHTITADQAQKLIDDAGRQRDQSIQAAKDQRQQVVSNLSQQNQEVISNMDTDTGKMLSPWQRLTRSIGDEFGKISKGWSDLNFPEKVARVGVEIAKAGTTAGGIINDFNNGNIFGVLKDLTGFATGTENATPGWHWVGEEGPELLHFAGGEKVINAQSSQDIVSQINSGESVKNATTNTDEQLKNTEKYGQDLNKNFGKGLTETLDQINTPVNTLSKNTTDTLQKLTASNLTFGQQSNKNYGFGISSTTGIVNNSVNSLTNGLGNILSSFAQTGRNHGTGLINELSQGIQESESNVTNIVNDLTTKVINQFKQGFGIHSPSRVMHSIGSFLMQGLVNGMTSEDVNSVIKSQIGDMTSTATGAVSGNLASWITTAMAITGTPMSYAPMLESIAMHESGGDPKNINLWDSNAAAGHPSKGVMQMIDETFNRWALPGLTDVWNPIDNIVSSIRYMIGEYGSIANVPGIRNMASGGGYVGYETGTPSATKGWHLTGEKGPELVYFNGGEPVLNNKDTVNALKNIQVPSYSTYKTANSTTNNNTYINNQNGGLSDTVKQIVQSVMAAMQSEKKGLSIKFVTPDSRELSEFIFDDINKLQGQQIKILARGQGMR